MLQLYLPFKTPKKITKSGIFIEISQKPMINEETLGFFTNPYPYLPKPVPVTRGAGFLGLGYGLARKTPGLPVPIPIPAQPHPITHSLSSYSSSLVMPTVGDGLSSSSFG